MPAVPPTDDDARMSAALTPGGSMSGADRATEADLVVVARRAVLPDGIRPAALVVRDGRIAAILDPDDPSLAPAAPGAPTSSRTLTAPEDCVLMPGLVDSHVHVNEPGRTAWEGFATATAAAAAGGITAIADMPLNSIPATTTLAALRVKQDAAGGQLSTDVAFWGGAVPGNLHELGPMLDAGVVGFKCFLLPSGVDEFPNLSYPQLREHCGALAQLDALLIAHAEDESIIDASANAGGRRYADFLASRPDSAETTAIDALLQIAAETGARVHIVHLSSARALPAIARAKADGVRLTVETCPHYLTLSAEHIPDGHTEFKCCPPIRDEANRDALWQALADGLIDQVVSDHSPCTPDLKLLDAASPNNGDFAAAWGGIASVQLALPAVWTEAASRGFALTDLARWMGSAPAGLTGLAGKGSLRIGGDADFSLFAPDERYVVDPTTLKHRNQVTAYAGQMLRGVVRETWLRGRRVDSGAPHGRMLERSPA
jgi:allantoinase